MKNYTELLFMKSKLIIVLCLAIVLCCACGSDGVAGSRRGISGTWCPNITNEQKNAYMEKAAEIMLQEYGLQVDSKNAVSPVVFVVSKGALPSNQKDAMERMDDWEYSVFVCTDDDVRYHVVLEYESMELRSVQESANNYSYSTGSFKELSAGEFYGLTEDFEQKAKTKAQVLQELLLSKDVEKLQNAMTKDSWEEVKEEAIDALFAAISDGSIEKGVCMPEIQVDDEGKRTDYLQYRFMFVTNTGESFVLLVKEVANENSDGAKLQIANISVRSGDNHGLGTGYKGISVVIDK